MPASRDADCEAWRPWPPDARGASARRDQEELHDAGISNPGPSRHRGLDQHQVRLWHSFHRHTVLSMCALALLAVATGRPFADEPGPAAAPGAPVFPRQQRRPDARALAGHREAPSQRGPDTPDDPGMVRVVGVPEARRLLHVAATPMRHAQQAFRNHWPRWRRRHQARARYHDYQAQLRVTPA